jgi:hypothetical protein
VMIFFEVSSVAGHIGLHWKQDRNDQRGDFV